MPQSFTTSEFHYDEILYPSFVFPQMNPDRIFAAATLRGLQAAGSFKCRMLELGCGDGTNLNYFASLYPSSEFVGIDLGSEHIRIAEEKARHLGLKNISFLCQDISDIDLDILGEFDYIAGHGLFSWVPDHVRIAIMQIFEHCLGPAGVGYLSYNVYPGCHIREITNNLMRFHTRNISEARQKVSSGLDFLKTIQAESESNSFFKDILGLEIPSITDRSIENIFHDDLSSHNKPFYFKEFSETLKNYGFDYLCDSNPGAINFSDVPERIRETIFQKGSDRIDAEQYLDMVQLRRFRTSLFTRDANQPSDTIIPECLDNLFVSSTLRPVEVSTDGSIKFSSNIGELSIGHELTKVVLVKLYEFGKIGAKFIDLVNLSLPETSIETETELEENLKTTRAILMKLYENGGLKIFAEQPTVATSLSRFPTVSPFARMQIAHNSKFVTTLFNENLEVPDVFVRNLLVLADGSKTVDVIESELSKSLTESSEGQANRKQNLSETVNTLLNEFLDSGLLVN